MSHLMPRSLGAPPSLEAGDAPPAVALLGETHLARGDPPTQTRPEPRRCALSLYLNRNDLDLEAAVERRGAGRAPHDCQAIAHETQPLHEVVRDETLTDRVVVAGPHRLGKAEYGAANLLLIVLPKPVDEHRERGGSKQERDSAYEIRTPAQLSSRTRTVQEPAAPIFRLNVPRPLTVFLLPPGLALRATIGNSFFPRRIKIWMKLP